MLRSDINKILVLLTLLAFSCESVDQTPPTHSASENGLIGAWEWKEHEYSGDDTSYLWTDVHGFIIFTEDAYSTFQIRKEGPRSLLADTATWANTPPDVLQGILGVVHANSGRYEVHNDSIYFYRQVALWPEAMQEKNQPLAVPYPTTITETHLEWVHDGIRSLWIKSE